MLRRRGRFGMAVVAVVLLAASACGAGDGGSRPSAGEGWRQLAASPLSPRIGHSAVWTGRELLIWGGRLPGGRPKSDGAAYDPAGDRWRRLPPAPLAGRFGHAAVWTGTELLIWGGDRPTGSAGRSEVALADGAAYQPATRTWRPIPPAPLAGDTAVWTGTELLAFGRVGAGSKPRLGGAAYDPRTERWRRLATSPLPAGNEFEVVQAGGTLAAFTYLDSERACHGGLYDLAAGTWRRLDACPLLPIMYPQPIWTGSSILLLTWGSEWFDGGDNEWGERVYTNGIYDPAADTWRPMTKAPFTREFASYAWTGTELLVWGGTTGEDCADGCPRADGLAYRPGRG